MKLLKLLNLFCIQTVLIFAMLSCTSENNQNKMLDLSTLDWEFRQVGTDAWYNASVPGNVISDLIDHGVLPDPLYRYNEDSAQWVEDQDWEFTAEFDLTEDQVNFIHQQIVFEGLDTYADVYINDSLVITADNMFHAWKSELNNVLVAGSNTLRIYFHSPIKIQNQRHEKLGYIAVNTNEFAPEDEKKRTFSRKAPFHYGWDWGPRLVTSGIWRPAYITFSNDASLENPYFRPLFVSKDSAIYTVEADISKHQAEALKGTFQVKLDGKVVAKKAIEISVNQEKVSLRLAIDNPELWWPAGYGEQHLYQAEVELVAAGKVIDRYETRLGVRDAKLVQKPDEVGRTFQFEINGIPVFAKGANYIPMHTLTTEVTDSMYQSLFEDALQANMNMLRVWGGAIYETERFYELCDENGILIWQDFMFACEMTPPVDYMYETIRKEAEYNVKRLRNHASIVLWCGNNENLMGWETWDWKTHYSEEIVEELDKGFRKIYYEILPKAVETYQPELSYWPSSPAAYPGDKLADRKSGDEHDWTIWFGQEKFEKYGVEVPRFASEYGIQAYPDMKTIKSFTEPEDREYKSDLMDYRQRSRMNWIKPGFNGNDMIKQYTEIYFPSPQDFDAHVYLSQLMQARALKTAVESHRASPRCMGSLYWQINDCWPTTSWATVDYFGRWKASHYAVKKGFQKVLAVPELNNKDISVTVVSELMEDTPMNVAVYEFKLNETVDPVKLAEQKSTIKALMRNVFEYADVLSGKENVGYFVEVTNPDDQSILASNIILPEYPKEYAFLKPSIDVKQTVTDGKVMLEFKSDVFAKGVMISTSVDGEYSDNYFDLLPGKAYQVTFEPYDKGKAGEIEFEVSSYADYI